MTAPVIKGPSRDIEQYPYEGSLAVPQYGFMLRDGTLGDYAIPAASQADQGTELANQKLARRRFIGLANEARPSTDTRSSTTFPVIRRCRGVFDCVSSTFEVGDLLAIDEQSGGTALENAKLVKTTDASIAIARATKRYATATTRVEVEIGPNVVEGQVWSFDGDPVAADTDGSDADDVVIIAGNGSAGGAHASNNPDGGDGGDVYISAGSGGAKGSGGSGAVGAPGKIHLDSLVYIATPQTLDMANTSIVLTVDPTAVAGTLITSNVMWVDANGGAVNLDLPPEAAADGLVLDILNTGGETITIRNDGAGTVVALATGFTCRVACDGTSWKLQMHHEIGAQVN